MRHINVIGIGAGDPDHLTLQAVKAFARTEVFLLLDKNEQRQELVELRLRMIEEHARPGHRVVQIPDAERDRTTPAYREAVDDWRRRRSELVESLITEHVGPDGTGALLVWGDPCLYDSITAVLDEILAQGRTEFSYDVVPGVSSVSVLAARHRTTLNRVGRPVRITTGRRLAAEGFPPGAEDAVVMLDGRGAFAGIDPEGVHIHYGAYLGTPDEILVSGPLADKAEEIARLRQEARDAKGWIMDTYLLRRTEG
ncbi:precorrin-6A synthase (deacetylating) [Streptacidiphilus anmyonensis]|uniref:precorrin-6A synthase (deacetylating) n=1 Tax=Streptacidiphilus anmyonensis TaxID=405782 RepID=UPI0005A8F04C|nr:precorrin-6A synthase (deacetylating) [Streptacidiphilus anmyonensis]